MRNCEDESYGVGLDGKDDLRVDTHVNALFGRSLPASPGSTSASFKAQFRICYWGAPNNGYNAR